MNDCRFTLGSLFDGKGDNITTDVLMKICEALNCHLDDIMETVDK